MLCKIAYGKLEYAGTTEFETKHSFDIICVCEQGYLLLVPTDLFMKNSFIISERDCKTFKIHKRFKDGVAHFAGDEHIIKLVRRFSGLTCMSCHEHYEYSEVNRIDDAGHGALICWYCRRYPYFK